MKVANNLSTPPKEVNYLPGIKEHKHAFVPKYILKGGLKHYEDQNLRFSAKQKNLLNQKKELKKIVSQILENKTQVEKNIISSSNQDILDILPGDIAKKLHELFPQILQIFDKLIQKREQQNRPLPENILKVANLKNLEEYKINGKDHLGLKNISRKQFNDLISLIFAGIKERLAHLEEKKEANKISIHSLESQLHKSKTEHIKKHFIPLSLDFEKIFGDTIKNLLELLKKLLQISSEAPVPIENPLPNPLPDPLPSPIEDPSPLPTPVPLPPIPGTEEKIPNKYPAAVYNAHHLNIIPGKKVFDNEFDTEDKLDSKIDSVQKAYKNAQKVLDTFKEELGIDFGIKAQSVVHYLVDYVNAFYDGQFMVYGDGDKYWKAFYEILDIAGHEMGHHIVGNLLEYYGESGALNEHFADILGAAVVMHSNKLSVDEFNWTIGDKIISYKGKEYSLRTFKEGKAFVNVPPAGGDDIQPDQVPDAAWYKEHADDLAYDEGGVHILSKIYNRVFYMVCMEQKDWKEPLKFWIKVLQTKITDPNTNFEELANIMLATALEDENFAMVENLQAAFTEVKVPFKKVSVPVKTINKEEMDLTQSMHISPDVALA